MDAARKAPGMNSAPIASERGRCSQAETRSPPLSAHCSVPTSVSSLHREAPGTLGRLVGQAPTIPLYLSFRTRFISQCTRGGTSGVSEHVVVTFSIVSAAFRLDSQLHSLAVTESPCCLALSE